MVDSGCPQYSSKENRLLHAAPTTISLLFSKSTSILLQVQAVQIGAFSDIDNVEGGSP